MAATESTGQTQRRGPAPGYSKEAIARAAIAIADEQGIEALTMRRIATALGTGAMSLYRYVESKDALYDLMIDEMVSGGAAELGEQLSGDWRTDLRTVAHGNRALQLQHPWFAKISAGRPAFGPNMLAIIERGMSILDGLGLGIDEISEILSLVLAWVSGFVQDELGRMEEQRRTGLSETAMQASLEPHVRDVIAAGRHPYFTRLVRDARHQSADERFERTLDRLIAGIEATLPDAAASG